MSRSQNGSASSFASNSKIISRADAEKARLIRYFTGEPCINGHIAERFVIGGACTECKRIKRAAYTAQHGERENANRAAYYRINRDAELARKAEYNKKFRAQRTSNQNKRRAKALRAVPPWFGEFDDFVISEAHSVAALRQASTGIEWHVDHMIPLQAKTASGFHVGLNIQVIPALINIKKNNRIAFANPGEWISAI